MVTVNIIKIQSEASICFFFFTISSTRKKYIKLNALFFPGIATETARAAEGKYLNPAIIEDTDRLTGILSALLSSFRESYLNAPVTTFRVERISDYRLMEERGQTVSFTSTSTAGFLSSYTDRSGIALMEFRLVPGVPCLDIANVLPEYAKPEEAEILLPPGAPLELTEIPLTQEQLTMTDRDGLPPQISVIVVPKAGQNRTNDCSTIPEGGEQAGIRVYKALNNRRTPAPDDIELFSRWKKAYTSALLSQE